MEKKFLMKIQNFIQNHLMVLQNFTLIGLHLFIESLMVYLLVMEYYLITKSPRRGETFVTRKITRFLTRKKLGSKEILYLGNLTAKRDWGHAKDYVEMQWRILQQKKADDFVIATGETYTVKHFIEVASKILNLKIIWVGKGLKEQGYLINNGKKELIVKIDKKYFRPNEVEYLKGDATKAFKKLNFKPKFSFYDLVKDMVESDLKLAEKEDH